MAGREPNFHKKYMVFWAKHLQMGPTKDIWGPLKLSYCLPPPTVFLERLGQIIVQCMCILVINFDFADSCCLIFNSCAPRVKSGSERDSHHLLPSRDTWCLWEETPYWVKMGRAPALVSTLTYFSLSCHPPESSLKIRKADLTESGLNCLLFSVETSF